MPEKEQASETTGELAFQAFCAIMFLSMIGMVFITPAALCLQIEFCLLLKNGAFSSGVHHLRFDRAFTVAGTSETTC